MSGKMGEGFSGGLGITKVESPITCVLCNNVDMLLQTAANAFPVTPALSYWYTAASQQVILNPADHSSQQQRAGGTIDPADNHLNV